MWEESELELFELTPQGAQRSKGSQPVLNMLPRIRPSHYAYRLKTSEDII